MLGYLTIDSSWFASLPSWCVDINWAMPDASTCHWQVDLSIYLSDDKTKRKDWFLWLLKVEEKKERYHQGLSLLSDRFNQQ